MKQLIKIAIVDDLIADMSTTVNKLKSIEMLPNLSDFNIDVSTYLNPKEFLSAKQKYDIALIDIEMPEMNGFELAAKVNLKSPETIIIFLTSHVERVYC